MLRTRATGLPTSVEIRPGDDRDLSAEGTSYHRAVSIETLESVGDRYFPGTVETAGVDDPLVLTRSGKRALGPIPGTTDQA